MKISDLAAVQKRILAWKDFLTISTASPQLKEKVASTLGVLSKILVDCWNSGEVSTDDKARILDLERQLEVLNEDIRLSAAQTLSRDLEK